MKLKDLLNVICDFTVVKFDDDRLIYSGDFVSYRDFKNVVSDCYGDLLVDSVFCAYFQGHYCVLASISGGVD